MNLERYQEHHSELHGLMGSMNRLLDPAGAPFEPLAVRALLVSLNAKLNIHLAFEDKALYPTLLKHPDQAIRLKTQTYMNEVGDLKAKMAAHLQRWLATERVVTEPGAFRAETRSFLRAVEHRLRAEDQDFYPLIERLA